MLIRNGTLVSGTEIFRADLLVQNGRIAGVGPGIAAGPGEEIVDAAGCLIMPGAIDAHTHFDMPAGDGMMTADDFYTGTRAAVAGGTTTILDFAEPQDGETLSDGLANWHRKADHRSFCDYGFHMTVSRWDEAMSKEFDKMIDQGVTSFKAYTAYKDSLGVQDSELYLLMKKAAARGALVLVHCENGDLIDCRVRELLETAPDCVMSHALSRPNLVEKEAVSRVVDFAALAEAPVYIVHVSAKESMEVIRQARHKGQRVFAETCPHYLLFNDAQYELSGLCGAKYVMSPPLRKLSDQRALWKCLKDGSIDTISTDHCAFNLQGQKDRGEHDFTKIPNGVPGVEHRVLLMLRFGQEQGLTLPELVRLLSENQARIFGLYPRKGSLSVGSDADIVILDPNVSSVISARKQVQHVDYTPYEGIRVNYGIKHVFLRGDWVVKNGKPVSEEPKGEFLARKTKEGDE